MSISQPSDRRANQKNRTRAAIVDAAISLLRDGTPPTVPEAAAAAKVSRATAYRYFPTQEALLVEAAAIAPVEPIERLVEASSHKDPRSRAMELQTMFTELALAEEPAMRMALRNYLDGWFTARERGEHRPQLREGRRTRWISTLLEPVMAELPSRERQRLVAALSLTMGIEPLIIMKDVCRLSDKDAAAVLRWAAERLLDAALPHDDALRD